MKRIPAKLNLEMIYIIQTFAYLMGTNNKDYCYPSQDKILDILKNYYDRHISLRTLNYDLKYLEEKGYIDRIRRIHRGRDGKIEFNSTIYKFGKKAFKILKNMFFSVQATAKKFHKIWNQVSLRTKTKLIKPTYKEDGRLDVSPYCTMFLETLKGV